MSKKRAAATTAVASWEDVPDAQNDAAVRKAAKEVEAFWIHGKIQPSAIIAARVRCRGTRRTKTNTDFEIDISCGCVVYKAAIKGEGDPKIRDPIDGRIWVTQPCVVCGKDDNEEQLLLCGTDDANAAVPGCERSFHTYCVGLSEVPDEDWFCPKCVPSSEPSAQPSAQPSAPSEPSAPIQPSAPLASADEAPAAEAPAAAAPADASDRAIRERMHLVRNARNLPHPPTA